MFISLVSDFSPVPVNLALLVAGFILFLIYHFNVKLSHWGKHGVPEVRPGIFESVMAKIRSQKPAVFIEQDIYSRLSGHKCGVYSRMGRPVLMLRDPELIRACLIKNFGHFHDRDIPFDAGKDPLSESLFVQRGKRWRTVRRKKAPAFSTGKLRGTIESTRECLRELDEFLTAAIETGSSGGELNLTELMANFSVDLMVLFSFGINCNTLRKGDSEFKNIGRDVFRKDAGDQKRGQEWFMSVLRNEIEERASRRGMKTDYLQYILDLQAEEKEQMQGSNRSAVHDEGPSLTETAIAASLYSQITLAPTPIANFFTYCLYEMALNPAIREKLKGEVDSIREECCDVLDYDGLRKLEYMDMVISETLRKHPSFPSLNRMCTENFQIPRTSIIVPEGTSIMVPTYALHNDLNLFPEPEKFWPERFSKENSSFIKPGSYLAFGIGPRGCMAERFSRFQIKSVLALIVSKFTVHPTEKTMIPLIYDCQSMGLTPKEDIWIRFKMRPTS